MKILHVAPRYLPAVGGAEYHLAELSERFAADGHDVTVLTSNAFDFEYLWDPSKQKIESTADNINGVKVIRLPVKHLPSVPRSYHALRRLLWLVDRSPLDLTKMATRLTQLAPQLTGLSDQLAELVPQHDLVGAVNIVYEGIAAAAQAAAYKHNRPFILHPLTHLGAGKVPGTDAQSQFYTMVHQKKLACSSSGLITLTQTEADFYVDAGMAAEKIAATGTGLNMASAKGGDGAAWRQKHNIFGTLVACICSLTADKGVPDLIEAVSRMSDESVTLVLAGTVTDEIKPILKTLDTERVRVLGRISADDKRDLLAACDIFAMPSRTDSFGIVYLEAWANRKPVIGSDAWGTADVIYDGVDGMLVPFGNAAALEEKLHFLITNPSEQVRMGNNGYQKLVEKHTWEPTYEQIKAHYLKTLERGIG
ncbi:MAG: glycosyltransferase family 4 protein [Chloroflexota bacterium]